MFKEISIEKYLEKMSKYYGFTVIFVYSILNAEYISDINKLVFTSSVEMSGFVNTFIKLNYGMSILVSILSWCITCLLFHLSAVMLDGDCKYKKFLYMSSYLYVFPIICIVASIFYFQSSNIKFEGENLVSEIIQNKELRYCGYIYGTGTYMVFFFSCILIKELYKLTWMKSIFAIVIPLLMIYVVNQAVNWL